MLKNLLFAMLIAAYHSTMPVYCFMQLFPRRINSKAKAFVHILVCFVLLSSFHMLKIYGHNNEMTMLTQIVMFLNLFSLFRGSIKKKLIAYFIILFTSILTELLALNIYIQIYNRFIHQHTYTAINIYSLCTFHEKLIIQLLIFSFAYLFYKNIFSLLRECINYLKFTLLLFIILPIFLPLIATEFLQHYKFSNQFIPVILYITCCCISFLLFIHGLKSLEQEQINFKQNLHKMELLKKQMEVSEEMKQEYIKIRKWNHDIENHLFSLAYLIDMKKTDAAEKYCNSVLSNNIDHNNHTSVCKSLNQEDSIL